MRHALAFSLLLLLLVVALNVRSGACVPSSALRELVKENYGVNDINISSESIYTGALGAAIFAWREGTGQGDPVGSEAAVAAGGAA